MIWIVNGLLVAGTPFLLLFGEYISDRINARAARKESHQ